MKLITIIVAGFMAIALILIIVASAGVVLGDNVAESQATVEEKYENRNLINQYSVGLHHEYQMAFMYILDPTSSNADEYLENKEMYCEINEETFEEIFEYATGDVYYDAMNDINEILLDMDVMFNDFVNDSASTTMEDRHALIDALDSQLSLIMVGESSDDAFGFDFVDQQLMEEINIANNEALADQELMSIVNLVGIVIAIASSVMLGGVIAKSISVPIHKITVASGKVKEGDLSVSVEEAGNTEIRELARSFNHMTASLRREISRREETELKLRDENNLSRFYVDLMSHDINNMNQGSLTSLQLMLLVPDLPETHKRYATVALQQTQRSANLISNVKKLSKLQANGFKLEKIDLWPVIDEEMENVKSEFQSKNFKFNSNVTEGKFHVKGNALLHDVFSNLLNNSAKFDNHDVVEIDIDINPSDEKGFWRIEYRDRGPGIMDHRKISVFNRLEKGDSNLHGSGLGLTLVKFIIESYGGRIWIEDRVKGNPSQGCNFVIHLPGGE